MERYFYNKEQNKLFKIPIVDKLHPFSFIINNSTYGIVKEITKEEYLRLLKAQEQTGGKQNDQIN